MHKQTIGAETFKLLDGYPAYRISTSGRLQSRWARGNRYGKVKYADWRDLKINTDHHGYQYVGLCDGISKPKTTKIHNIVLRAFVGEKRPGQCVRHLDGNKANNSIHNLKYGSYKENEDDKLLHGTWGRRITNRKLMPTDIDEIRVSIKEGISDKELAVKYGVSRPTITRIRNNKIWKLMS